MVGDDDQVDGEDYLVSERTYTTQVFACERYLALHSLSKK